MKAPAIFRFRLPNGDVIVSLRQDILERAIAAANAQLKLEREACAMQVKP